jgi:hypothetical protein
MYGAAHRVDYRNTNRGASVTISIPLGERQVPSSSSDTTETAVALIVDDDGLAREPVREGTSFSGSVRG